jgi:GT2 family glycosyltransferase
VKKVYIIILNYNGWRDTLECLESVLRSSYAPYQVIVIDNHSPDRSLDYIARWAEGHVDVWTEPANPLRQLSFPPVEKPLPYISYSRKEAEGGGDARLEAATHSRRPSSPLIFVQTGENLGYAGGNNVGIRYALAKADFDHIWILNNDTVVHRDALRNVVSKAEALGRERQKTGMVGSKLLYYDSPSSINGIGGSYNKWFSLPAQIGMLEEDEGQYDGEDVKIDYVMGSSVLVSREFLRDVGLLCEDYFLYYEEVDWAERGRRKAWGLSYSAQSRVYHKEGAATGVDKDPKKKSQFSDYYLLRNKIRLTKKFYRRYLWSVYLGFIPSILRRLKRGQPERVLMLLRILKEEAFKNSHDRKNVSNF